MTSQGRLLDELAANATVAPVTRLVDGWLAKAAPALPFRRASSVLPATGAGTDHRAATATLDVLEAWYRSLGLRLLVQVSSADPAADALDDLLAARGAEVEAPVDVLVADTRQVVDAAAHAIDGLWVEAEEVAAEGTQPVVNTTVMIGVSDLLANHLARAHGADQVARDRTLAYGSMLAGLGPSAFGGGVNIDGEVVGLGFAVLERGWAGIFGMATAPSWRRTGVAATMLAALAGAAADRHGTRLYLQVETENDAAQSLYRGLGFARHHGYHYRALTPVAPLNA